MTLLEPQRHLVLRSREHLPPEWSQKYGASIDWSWAFTLDELAPNKTRFIFRSRLHLKPAWVEGFLPRGDRPADFIMSRQMLRGVKARAEATTAQDLTAVT